MHRKISAFLIRFLMFTSNLVQSGVWIQSIGKKDISLYTNNLRK